MHALLIDDSSSTYDFSVAAEMLEQCNGTVTLNSGLVLRPTPEVIFCEVIDPSPGTHRCAEEFNVLIENAARTLNKSKLSNLLPDRPLQWSVVTDGG